MSSTEATLRLTVAALMRLAGERQADLAAGLRLSQAQISLRQSSPASARLRPVPPAGRPTIVFDPHSPTEFQHEHYKISLRKRLAETPSGGVLEITAQARLDVPGVAGPSAVTAAELHRQDQEVEDGLFARPALPASAQPWVAFPPYRIVVDSASEEEAQDMMWRALDGAVTIADRCLDVLGQVAPCAWNGSPRPTVPRLPRRRPQPRGRGQGAGRAGARPSAAPRPSLSGPT